MSTTSSAVSTSASVTVQWGVHAGNLSRGRYDGVLEIDRKKVWSSRDIELTYVDNKIVSISISLEDYREKT